MVFYEFDTRQSMEETNASTKKANKSIPVKTTVDGDPSKRQWSKLENAKLVKCCLELCAKENCKQENGQFKTGFYLSVEKTS